MAAKRLGRTSVRVMVDNAPACHALQRGVSSNFRANKWLAAIQDMTLHVTWVPSASQLADPYTRGVKGRPPPRVPPRDGSILPGSPRRKPLTPKAEHSSESQVVYRCPKKNNTTLNRF